MSSNYTDRPVHVFLLKNFFSYSDHSLFLPFLVIIFESPLVSHLPLYMKLMSTHTHENNSTTPTLFSLPSILEGVYDGNHKYSDNSSSVIANRVNQCH